MGPAISSAQLHCANRVLDLSCPAVMGILNVTPDSFSDGGRFFTVDQALYHAEAMVAAGAAIVDVGGESTRPGAPIISEQEELERVAPVLEAIVNRLDVLVSVDTSTPLVMREAIGLGVGMVNDVRALTRPGALEVVAASQVAVCLMHMRAEPKVMQQHTQYHDLMGEIRDFLSMRATACALAGISKERVLLDPGFGFAKTPQQNLYLMNQLGSLHVLGYPLMLGASRKSTIGVVLERTLEERLYGSLALAALAVMQGVQLIRAHDVAQTMDVLRMVDAVRKAMPE